MKWPFVARALYDAAVTDAKDWARLWERSMERRDDESQAAQARYDDLLNKYHTLREKGYGHLEAFPIAAKGETFGPRTRAALDAMSKGLPRDARVAMEARAADFVAQGMDDGHVADLVKRGEPLRIAL